MEVSPQDAARFGHAHASYAAGDLTRAATVLTELLTKQPAFAEARHLLAIVERRLGHAASARAHFEEVIRLAPNDPHVRNNYANLLTDMDELSSAILHYEQAVTLSPSYVDGWTNLGLVNKRLGKFTAAEVALAKAVRLAPTNSKAWLALGLTLKELGETKAAADALDQALVLQPENSQALHARALLEAEIGGVALPFYERARSSAPDDPEIRLGYAAARHECGDSAGAVAELEQLVREQPEWLKGHAALAQLKWQLGDIDHFVESFETALSHNRSNASLWISYLSTLSRAGLHACSLKHIEDAYNAVGRVEALLAVEANAATESWDLARADRAFAKLDVQHSPAIAVAKVRHLLRSKRPDEAGLLCEQLIAEDQAPAAWSYLSIAWRLLDDRRWEWLEGDDRFVGSYELPEIQPHLDGLARLLRGLHLTRIQPFDQTLRGGTQTDGTLLARAEPDIQLLKRVLSAAVARHIAQFPPADPSHPLLREPRSGFRFSGSWSVRLFGEGFHINHIHPGGWLSSAFYIVLPEVGVGDGSDAGWLSLGEPPVELGLSLSPLRLVEAKRGWLTLFPSYMWHGTVPFAQGERLSVAFDVKPLPLAAH
jgi:Tfp pilus assembly protein PilF